MNCTDSICFACLTSSCGLSYGSCGALGGVHIFSRHFRVLNVELNGGCWGPARFHLATSRSCLRPCKPLQGASLNLRDAQRRQEGPFKFSWQQHGTTACLPFREHACYVRNSRYIGLTDTLALALTALASTYTVSESRLIENVLMYNFSTTISYPFFDTCTC